MIVVVDYGMGNIGSILNMLKRIGAPARISSVPGEIATAQKIILPGVGAFDRGMSALAERGLLPVLHAKALQERVPVLGICLGMQLLTEGSDEGRLAGLGWVQGRSIRFRPDAANSRLKVPHMGWNTVAPRRRDSLFADLDPDHGFYFVHSFYVHCTNDDDVLATTVYGNRFASAVQHQNVLGTQFHPEKSHRHGLRLLQKFVEL